MIGYSRNTNIYHTFCFYSPTSGFCIIDELSFDFSSNEMLIKYIMTHDIDLQYLFYSLTKIDISNSPLSPNSIYSNSIQKKNWKSIKKYCKAMDKRFGKKNEVNLFPHKNQKINLMEDSVHQVKESFFESNNLIEQNIQFVVKPLLDMDDGRIKVDIPEHKEGANSLSNNSYEILNKGKDNKKALDHKISIVEEEKQLIDSIFEKVNYLKSRS